MKLLTYNTGSILTAILLITNVLFTTSSFAQVTKKTYTTTKIQTAPKIDGNLDDSIWQNKAVATGFTQTIPYNGRPATQKTEVKIVYTNEAIYLGAMLYDSSPDSILMGLGKRDAEDDAILSDLFIVEFNPYNDDQLLNAFKLSASGVQIDERVTYGNWDKSWDAVWYSATSINDSGWIAEIKIPYAALRIPQKEEQIWGMHLWRCIKRNEEWASWNFVNEKEESTVHQAGILQGIENIEPPVRLSFTPYISSYVDKNGYTQNTTYSFKGGLDVKYGLNESYTLDMMLIPDFGQVQSDDAVLNLTSVETYYDEKRSFFTEGTELFSKADIFYSRRIGGIPSNFDSAYSNIGTNQIVSNNPIETQIINATKVSGRNTNGLAVGVLNAVTANTHAELRDTLQNTTSKVLTQPLTNYNVLVIDQSLKNNSTISFINTNAAYYNSNYVANVTGTDFKFANKQNTYALFGKGALSQLYSSTTDLGYYYDVSIRKTNGNFKFALNQRTVSDTYNPTDLGYLANNNEIQNTLTLSYDFIEPFGRILSWYNSISFYNSQLYKPNQYAAFEINEESHITFRNHLMLSIYMGGTPIKKYDFYEPRVSGWKYEEPTACYLGSSMQTDAKRRLSLFLHAAHWQAFEYNKITQEMTIRPTLRANNKFILALQFDATLQKNAFGYVGQNAQSDSIYFGRRDVNYIASTLEANYIFSNKASLSMRARHYWTTVAYKQFYLLNTDGTMNDNIQNFTTSNTNYNNVSIDVIYTWQFAPGSELSFMWKNNIDHYINSIDYNYLHNLKNTWNASQFNTFSLKIKYYLDYNYLVRNH